MARDVSRAESHWRSNYIFLTATFHTDAYSLFVHVSIRKRGLSHQGNPHQIIYPNNKKTQKKTSAFTCKNFIINNLN